MSSIGIVPVIGGPRIGSEITSSYRKISRGGDIICDLGGGKVINGTKSRDPGNTGFTHVLRSGLLMGKIAATGLYANSFFGTLAVAFSNGTSMTVSVATALELVRRIGTSGTFTLTGPPTANGTVAVTTVTYSAVNTSTGVITVTDPGVAKVAGSLIGDTDGSQTPITFVPDGNGVRVTDVDGTNLSVPFPQVPIRGTILSANVLPVWPADTSIQTWIKSAMNAAGVGTFVFDDSF